MATSLPTLPIELWDSIFSYLWYPDLTSVALTSKTFKILVHDTLLHDHALWSKWHHVCHDVGSLFHNHDPKTGRLWPILIAVLRDPVAIHYIEHLDFISDTTSMPNPPQAQEDNQNQPENKHAPNFTPTPSEIDLIDRALRGQNLWTVSTPTGRPLRLREAILTQASENAMAALLLLKTPNLHTLTLPTLRNRTLHNNKWLQNILSTVSLLAASQKPGTAGLPLPLFHLRKFTCMPFHSPDPDDPARGPYWSQLQSVMALPNLRNLVIHGVEDWSWVDGSSGNALPEWPAHSPKSQVRDVEIVNGSLLRSGVVAFARGIEGPCVIRQAWRPGGRVCVRRRRGLGAQREWEWDVLEIPSAGAGEEEWKVGLTHARDGVGGEVERAKAVERHRVRERDERRWRWQCCLDGEGCWGCVHCREAGCWGECVVS